MTTSTIVVLNDGETFTAAGGCKVLDVDPDATTEEIEEALKDMDRDLAAGKGVILGPDTTLMQVVLTFDTDGRAYDANGEEVTL